MILKQKQEYHFKLNLLDIFQIKQQRQITGSVFGQPLIVSNHCIANGNAPWLTVMDSIHSSSLKAFLANQYG